MPPSETPPSPPSVVAALLAAHDLDVSPADLAALEQLYPAIRRRMARLYAVACGDGAPILLGKFPAPSGGNS